MAAVLLALGACKRHWSWPGEEKPAAEAPVAPTPTPKPTPIYIPQKKLEVSKLFNGMEVRTTVESDGGGTATQECETPGSYALELNIKVKVPRASQSMEALSRLNASLPDVLPGLAGMLATARVSDKYETLYGRKLAQLKRNLPRLDQLLTRHNFFDCETILELRHPQTRRTVVLLQADMDVDTDGSDPDRLPAVDANDPTFQPMTSYHWPKQTELLNPFLPGRETRLRSLESELAHAKGLGQPRVQALRDAVGAARYEVGLLKTRSFLIAATDPYVVLPGIMTEGMDPEFQPRVGDYCAVIHGHTIYPAIIGDIGPRDVVGEASYRLAKEINSEASPLHRSVDSLKVTYLFFPNSADKPFGPPDFSKWQARIESLLEEIGGTGGTIHTWTTLSRPAPTPTPTPSPTPVPSATPAATPLVPGILPGGTPATPATPSTSGSGGPPTPMPTPSATPGETPAPCPSATPASTAPKPALHRKKSGATRAANA